MDSDSPDAERMAADQPTQAGSRFFMLGGSFGTKSETGVPFTRLAVGTASAVAAPRRHHHREPLGQGPAP